MWDGLPPHFYFTIQGDKVMMSSSFWYTTPDPNPISKSLNLARRRTRDQSSISCLAGCRLPCSKRRADSSPVDEENSFGYGSSSWNCYTGSKVPNKSMASIQSSPRRFYPGGFERVMTRQEAALILGVSFP